VAAVAAVMVAGVAVTGCDVGMSGESRHGSRTFDAPHGSLTLLVDNDVTIVPGHRGRLTVDRWLTGKATRHATWRQRGDRLTLRAPCVGVSVHCSARYRVAVPADLPVSVATGYGQVAARDLTGGLNVDTDNGDVALTNVTGRIRISDQYGGVTAGRLGSTDVTVASENGDVRLAFTAAPKRATVRSTYGAISLTVPESSYHVTTRSRYGEVSSAVTDHPAADRVITADTDNGDVSVRTRG